MGLTLDQIYRLHQQHASQLARPSVVRSATSFVTPQTEAAFYKGPLGKILGVIGKGEELGSGAILGSILKSVSPDRYQYLKDRGGPIYASDWMRQLLPKVHPAIRAPLGLAAGILMDPLSYVTLGPFSKTAKGFLAAGRALGKPEIAKEMIDLARKAGVAVYPKARRAFWIAAHDAEEAMARSGGQFAERFYVAGVKRGSEFVEEATVQAAKAPRSGAVQPFLDEDHMITWVRSKGKRAPTKKAMEEGTQFYRILELEDEGVEAARAIREGRTPAVTSMMPGGTMKATRDFLQENLDALASLTLEDKARKGYVSLVQLNLPFTSRAYHIGKNWEEGLRKLGMPEHVAKELGAVTRGAPVYKLVDEARQAMANTAFGKALAKRFGFKWLLDPRYVALWHKMMDPARGMLGKFGEEVGGSLERTLRQMTDDIYKIDPTKFTRDEVRQRLNSLINDLGEQRVFSKTAAAGGKGKTSTMLRPGFYTERVSEYFPDRYTSPLLGGPDHVGDTPFLKQIRESVRQANEFNYRNLIWEAQAGVPVSALAGDIDYFLHATSDLSRKQMREHRKGLAKGYRTYSRNALDDLLAKDMSTVSRSFTTLNVDEIIKLLAYRAPKMRRDELMGLINGIKTHGVDIREIEHKLKIALEMDVVSASEYDTLMTNVRNLFTGKVDREKARTEALRTFSKWYQNDVISRDVYVKAVHPWGTTEVNEYVWEKGIPSLGIKPHTNPTFFIPDVPLQVYLRGQRAIRVVTEKQMLEAFAKEFGTLNPNVMVEGYNPIKGLENFIAGGEKIMFPDGVHTFLSQYTKFLTNPDSGLSRMLRVFDMQQRWWKAWTLAVFPAYHSRNAIGNMWNNYLAGMEAPQQIKYGIRAEKFLRAMSHYEYYMKKGEKALARKSLGKHTINVQGKQVGVLKLWEEGRARNLWNTGFATGDIEDSARRLMIRHGRELKKHFIGTTPTLKTADLMNIGVMGENSWFLDAGFRVAGRIENNAKLSHFMWRLAQGDTYDEAAMSVKKFLFDYTDLTSTERSLMKRMLPFYTWTRKNIPLQLEMLVHSPERFARIPKTIRAATDGMSMFGLGYDTPPDERLMVDWMKDAFPARVGKNKKGQHIYFLMDSWLPAMDLNKMANPWFLLKSMAAPLPKTVLEQCINQELRTGREIDKLEGHILKGIMGKGERERFFGLYLPRRATYTAKGYLRILRDMDKFFANPDDMALWQRILALGFGKTYASDPSRGYLEMARQVRQIGVAYNFAARSQIFQWGDTRALEEARRILRLRAEKQAREVKKRRG